MRPPARVRDGRPCRCRAGRTQAARLCNVRRPAARVGCGTVARPPALAGKPSTVWSAPQTAAHEAAARAGEVGQPGPRDDPDGHGRLRGGAGGVDPPAAPSPRFCAWGGPGGGVGGRWGGRAKVLRAWRRAPRGVLRPVAGILAALGDAPLAIGFGLPVSYLADDRPRRARGLIGSSE